MMEGDFRAVDTRVVDTMGVVVVEGEVAMAAVEEVADCWKCNSQSLPYPNATEHMPSRKVFGCPGQYHAMMNP